ncbi:MAG TPA: glycoside hydrolase family 15 protein, partial [Candidatus Wildermuthbacteria bacterium]|nr:glycoside hydrolase family 15 protein [Candidatus Wildermuthbacteria bacterium]
MYKPIRDYGIIGNLRSAALVAKDGSIDWKPAPYLDSPSVFAAILDHKKGGRWKIAPIGDFSSEQEYMGQSNILITRFTGKEGVVELIDYIPAQLGGDMGAMERAEVHRKVVCTKGEAKVLVEFSPRFDYARGKTTLSATEHGVSVAHKGEQKGELVSPGEYIVKDDTATTTISLKEGESAYLAFHYHASNESERNGEHYEKELSATKSFWEEWVGRCDLDSCPVEYPYHESVIRSSLVLKILFFEPPGSIAAAPTTSLPETIGGERNWDYRFSWIRDSAFTLQALFELGYTKEANQYVNWLLSECKTIEDGPEKLQVIYGLRGEKNLKEEVLSHLEGYEGSRPVRIGNKAYKQKQWDVYGGLLDAVWQLHLHGSHVIDSELWASLRSIANYVVKIWGKPDNGLWEVRDGLQHFVHSKLMCWVALDRALKLAESHGLNGEIELWEKEREKIRAVIFEKGWSEKKQSFVQSFGSQNLDASLLLMPTLGFIDGKDPKMRSTIARIKEELGAGDGLLY